MYLSYSPTWLSNYCYLSLAWWSDLLTFVCPLNSIKVSSKEICRPRYTHWVFWKSSYRIQRDNICHEIPTLGRVISHCRSASRSTITAFWISHIKQQQVNTLHWSSLDTNSISDEDEEERKMPAFSSSQLIEKWWSSWCHYIPDGMKVHYSNDNITLFIKLTGTRFSSIPSSSLVSKLQSLRPTLVATASDWLVAKSVFFVITLIPALY